MKIKITTTMSKRLTARQNKAIKELAKSARHHNADLQLLL
jgi:hypothetical protein